jgi:hypothetical protein
VVIELDNGNHAKENPLLVPPPLGDYLSQETLVASKVNKVAHVLT